MTTSSFITCCTFSVELTFYNFSSHFFRLYSCIFYALLISSLGILSILTDLFTFTFVGNGDVIGDYN